MTVGSSTIDTAARSIWLTGPKRSPVGNVAVSKYTSFASFSSRARNAQTLLTQPNAWLQSSVKIAAWNPSLAMFSILQGLGARQQAIGME